MNWLKREKLWPVEWAGLLQALGVVAYVALVGLIFWKGNTWFGTMHKYLGPVMVLLLLVVSVLSCALLVLYYPYILFFEKNKKMEAVRIVAWTTGWLVVAFLISMLVMMLL